MRTLLLFQIFILNYFYKTTISIQIRFNNILLFTRQDNDKILKISNSPKHFKTAIEKL